MNILGVKKLLNCMAGLTLVACAHAPNPLAPPDTQEPAQQMLDCQQDPQGGLEMPACEQMCQSRQSDPYCQRLAFLKREQQQRSLRTPRDDLDRINSNLPKPKTMFFWRF